MVDRPLSGNEFSDIPTKFENNSEARQKVRLVFVDISQKERKKRKRKGKEREKKKRKKKRSDIQHTKQAALKCHNQELHYNPQHLGLSFVKQKSELEPY